MPSKRGETEKGGRPRDKGSKGSKRRKKAGLPKSHGSKDPPRKGGARRKNAGSAKDNVSHYTHNDKRKNTPPVGLATPGNDKDDDPGCYDYNPRLDPILLWSKKYDADRLCVPTVSLHLHERIDPTTIISKILKKETHTQETISSFFKNKENDLDIKKAVEFYEHSNNWSNRLIAGDSLLVMNSLIQKEDMAGKVQLIYIDPPYGIKYGSNFQPFVCKREVKDRNDADIPYEPETINAFRDTWEYGIHSYLSYLRDRLVLANSLLASSGSCAVQISDENVHYVRMIMDEVFGKDNFVSLIQFRKTPTATSNTMPIVCDYIVWYAKDIQHLKYHKMYRKKNIPIDDPNFRFVELKNGTRRRMSPAERHNPLTIPTGSRIYRHYPIISKGKSSKDDTFVFKGKEFSPGPNSHWTVNLDGMYNLAKKNLLVNTEDSLYVVTYFDDHQHREIDNMWLDTSSGGFEDVIYVVQTSATTIRRFLLMTTDPGDLVLDPTCGSGTTAYVAEQFGRRWITCDTSRVSITLAKRRLMTAIFKYYALQHPEQGISAGFSFSLPDGVMHKITAKTRAHNQVPEEVTLHDRPDVDRTKSRVTGPFTVEAVPAQTAMSIDAMYGKDMQEQEPDAESTRQAEWRDALKSSGIRAKGGQKIEFARMDPHPSSRWLHAVAKTNESSPKTVFVSFGPKFAALETRQVEAAIQDLRKIRDADMLVFVSMQFDPEAAKTIDELNWEGVTMLKAQMNADMLVGDLKKKPGAGSDLFMLMGQPDAVVKKAGSGKFRVQVRGFDYYNTGTDKIESGGTDKIVMWMLDTDYDGRSLYPQQVFFPMGNGKDGNHWSKIAKTLQAHIDENLLKTYTGTESLEFEFGEHGKVAVKIIDDRGVESVRVLPKPGESGK